MEVLSQNNHINVGEMLLPGNGGPGILSRANNGSGCYDDFEFILHAGTADVLHNFVELLQNIDVDCTGFAGKLQQFTNDNLVDSSEGHKIFADLGVTCLKVFVQANWTGPPVDTEKYGALGEIIMSKELNDKSVDILESNGDEIYQLLTYPVLLLISYMVLLECSNKLHLYPTLPLWSVKCLSAYLSVNDEVNEQHLAMFQNVVDKVEKEVEEFPKELLPQFYMCCCHLYLKCYNYTRAKDCLDHVKELLQIEVSLTASLGKRTKFQVKDLPQMKLDVITGKNRDSVENKGGVMNDLPVDVFLDNDTLLPHIKFVDESNVKSVDLSPLDQAFILCNCIYLQKTTPRDKLSHEELLPFIDTVLVSPQSWSIQSKSLFLRCIVEMYNSRKVERAITQLESLVKTINKPTPQGKERLLYVQEVDVNPTWVNEQVHAQTCCTYGLVDTALEIFIRLHLWNDVITCYQRLGKHGKAEEVIRNQLQVRESATLWCLLGDCTVEKQYYEKAWEFSKHRNARSQRSLGLWHLRRKEFEEAIPYFEKSLQLNCLQPETAFSMGCSCMATDNIQKACKAFQACVSFDPENHQAWNNLASNYIRLGQIQKGYKALQESTRLSYDNWRIWENFLLVATDIGAFEDSILACNRLVELKRKTIDVEVLNILVKAMLDDEVDMHGSKAGRLKPKLFKLFAHITSQITSDPHVWETYAKLTLSDEELSSKEKGLQYLYKSHRCYTQNTIWEKHEDEVHHVMRVTNQMMQVTDEVCRGSDHREKVLTLATTTRMALSNLLIRLKKAFCDNHGKPLASMEPHIAQLDQHITDMQSIIDSYPAGV